MSSDREGEEYINAYLHTLKEGGQILDYEWVSDINAVSPFDFRIQSSESVARVIDVKSTSGPFARRIHISLNELRQMAHGTEAYELYRVYDLSEEGASLRKALDVRAFALSVLNVLEKLPQGVRSDGISLLPNTIEFDEEEIRLATPFIDG